MNTIDAIATLDKAVVKKVVTERYRKDFDHQWEEVDQSRLDDDQRALVEELRSHAEAWYAAGRIDSYLHIAGASRRDE